MYEQLKNIIFSKYFFIPYGVVHSVVHSYYAYKMNSNGAKVKDHRHLDKSEAMKRADHISDLDYKIFLNLSETEGNKINQYNGKVQIEFSLTQTEGLFLDFFGKIEQIEINNKVILIIKKDANRIYIDAKDLVHGRNSIIINFKSQYSQNIKDPKGLILSKNEDEKNVVFTTCMEPFKAHYVFPCLDQPSLKSNFELTVAAHKNLTFISNSEIESTITDKFDKNYTSYLNNEKEMKITKFKTIKHIYSHQVTLTGGNFQVFKDSSDFKEVSNFVQKPKINFYFQNNINNNNEFDLKELILDSINWFTSKFDFTFPYSKLDLVFLPNISGSSPGSVILLNDKLLNGCTDVIDKNYFNLNLVTGIAQMWLSNFISIKWWDDSFFYQSLTLFLTHLYFKEKCDYDNKPSDDESLIWPMFDFFKSKAVLADRSMDSHQVVLDIDDTEEADILIDSEISIFKTASLFKYLYSLDKQNFLHVVKNFVSGNSALSVSKSAGYKEFIGIFEIFEENKEDKININIYSPLNQFEFYLTNEKVARLTLKIPRLNDSETFNKIVIIQEFPCLFNKLNSDLENISNNQEEIENETYYPYVIDILLKYADTEIIVPGVRVKPKRVNLITLDKEYLKPLCVILNPNDNAYMTQKFEVSTRNYLIENTSEIKHVSTRILIVRDLYELVKEGEYDPLLYIKFCENLLKRETNIYIINKVISHSISVIENYIPQSSKNSHKKFLFKLLSEKYFKQALYEKHLYKNMVNFLLDLSNSKDADNIKFLLEVNLDICLENVIEVDEGNIYEEKEDESKQNENLTNLDQRTKERVVEAIYESDRFNSIQKQRLKKSILRDNNECNTLNEFIFQTCALDSNHDSIRESLWKVFIYRDKEYNEKQIKYFMKGFNRQQIRFFNSSTDGNRKIYFKKKFFKDFPYVCESYTEEYAIMFYKNLKPDFLIEERILKKYLKMKRKINFDAHPNNALKYLIENDILELKHKLLVMKVYSSLQLYGLKNNGFKKF